MGLVGDNRTVHFTGARGMWNASLARSQYGWRCPNDLFSIQAPCFHSGKHLSLYLSGYFSSVSHVVETTSGQTSWNRSSPCLSTLGSCSGSDEWLHCFVV
eukprot:gnl/MRDRNA2_/MRDRNA2_777705_c0_seq1.p2 gnl/MRDRNA2_/MRDRNA2_777705_c0~~gnl/MRDRNA2_/MRDRNA2_777705_c0_seq1.p2  ORF type:complete len:100 (+),score=6.42 gnl/MRDRNA2_/MRDRNA2_777705_c0_seq1:171-470(+)